MRLHEVSIVAAPANRDAVIHLRKEHPMLDKLKAAIAKIRTPAEAFAAAPSPEAAEQVRKARAELNQVIDEHLTEGGTVADVKKALTDCTDDDLAAEMGRRKAAASSDEDLAAEAAKRKGKVGKGETPPPATAAVADVTKSATELLIEKQAELLQKQADAFAKVAAEVEVMKGERDHAKLVTVAKEMIGDVGTLKAEELADILKKLDEKERGKLESLYKAANSIQRDTGLYLVRGTSERTSPDAADQINKVAADLMKSDPEIMKADPKVREDLAITKALEQNPDLYDAYERENPTRKASSDD